MGLVGDYADFQNGFAFKSKEFCDDGEYNVIKIKELKNGKIRITSDTAKVKHMSGIEKYIVKKGDVVFALTGDPVSKPNPLSWVGRVSLYNMDCDAVLNQRVCKVLPKQGLNLLYLYYFFRNGSEFYQLAGKATGSASQANISTKTISDTYIDLPNIEYQNKVVKILNTIDRKIEINEGVNDNLLQKAQTIYCDMFITKANDSWRFGHLSDLITVRYGKDHKKLADGIYPVYGSGGIMRYVEKPLYDKESVLIPRKGTLNNVMYVNEPFWSVDTMFFTEMKQSNIAKFVFHFVKSKDLASLNAGSAVPSMTTDILNAMELRIPDTDTLSKFESIVAPMYQNIQLNTQESGKLAELRDSLLPRLMSGELDVSELDI